MVHNKGVSFYMSAWGKQVVSSLPQVGCLKSAWPCLVCKIICMDNVWISSGMNSWWQITTWYTYLSLGVLLGLSEALKATRNIFEQSVVLLLNLIKQKRNHMRWKGWWYDLQRNKLLYLFIIKNNIFWILEKSTAATVISLKWTDGWSCHWIHQWF